MQRAQSLTGNTPDELERLAVMLDGIAATVEAVELDDSNLEAFRHRYAALSRELAAASRETKVALDTNDAKRADCSESFLRDLCRDARASDVRRHPRRAGGFSDASWYPLE